MPHINIQIFLLITIVNILFFENKLKQLDKQNGRLAFVNLVTDDFESRTPTNVYNLFELP